MRSHQLLAAAALLLPVVAIGATPREQQVPHGHRVERFRLTQTGGGLGVDVQETVTFSGGAGTNGWPVERRRTDSNWCGRKENGACAATKISVHQWTSANDCPALKDVMSQLPNAQSAALAVQRELARKHGVFMVTDTPLLTLETLPKGRIRSTKQSEWIGPLVDWWSRGEQSLKACWTDYPA